MHRSLLPVLRCPACGTALRLEPGPATAWAGEDLSAGVLSCECCAYPVVAGIAYVRPGSQARGALALLEQGRSEAALAGLLGLDPPRAETFERRRNDPRSFTFREALGLFCADAEAPYFLHRFSDPTYLTSAALLRAVDLVSAPGAGWALDLGGGAGHLARSLDRMPSVTQVVLADLHFWKLWLAREYVAPACQAICCDANAPLPFARGSFALAVCSDAINYVWQRRLLVGELLRSVSETGTLLLTHMHNALCDNPSAGMPLTPAGYRNLFETRPVRLYPERAILDAVIGEGPIDLRAGAADADLAAEASLVALATGRTGVLAVHEPTPEPAPAGPLTVNPLYGVEIGGPPGIWLRQFPSAEYEAEFGAARRYLPERVALSGEQLRAAAAGDPAGQCAELRRRRVLLELPERYL